MMDRHALDEVKQAGAGQDAPESVVALYRKAFRDFGAHMLWNRSESAHPTIAQAIAVSETLRREGTMRSRPLAAEIEKACRAAL